jgi:hypothetical protein
MGRLKWPNLLRVVIPTEEKLPRENKKTAGAAMAPTDYVRC